MNRKSKTLSSALCGLAAFAAFAGSIPAQAHGIWFAQRAKQIGLIYGVGADDLDALTGGEGAAGDKLILDRGLLLQIAGEAGVKGRPHQGPVCG